MYVRINYICIRWKLFRLLEEFWRTMILWETWKLWKHEWWKPAGVASRRIGKKFLNDTFFLFHECCFESKWGSSKKECKLLYSCYYNLFIHTYTNKNNYFYENIIDFSGETYTYVWILKSKPRHGRWKTSWKKTWVDKEGICVWDLDFKTFSQGSSTSRPTGCSIQKWKSKKLINKKTQTYENGLLIALESVFWT